MIAAFALLLTVISLAMLLFGCLVVVSKNSGLAYIFLFSIVASGVLLAYVSAPFPGSDLSRYFTIMNNFNLYGLSYWETSVYSGSPIANGMMYAISLTGDYHLLPAFSSLVTLILLICLLRSQQALVGSDSRFFCMFLIVVFASNSVMAILLSCRQQLAFVVLAAAVSSDILGKPFRSRGLSFLLYLVSLGIHYACFPIIALRLLVLLFAKHRLLACLILVFGCAGVAYAVQPFAGTGGFLGIVADKFIEYGEVEYSDFRYVAMRGLLCATMLFVAVKTISKSEESLESPKAKYFLFLSFIFAASLLFIGNQTLMSRMISFGIYSSYPLLAEYFCKKKTSDKAVQSLVAGFGLTICTVAAIAYQYVSITNQWQLVAL